MGIRKIVFCGARHFTFWNTFLNMTSFKVINISTQTNRKIIYCYFKRISGIHFDFFQTQVYKFFKKSLIEKMRFLTPSAYVKNIWYWKCLLKVFIEINLSINRKYKLNLKNKKYFKK